MTNLISRVWGTILEGGGTIPISYIADPLTHTLGSDGLAGDTSIW